jgi:hypothetical protein
VLEQAAWVVEASSSATRYLPPFATFTISTAVDDTFRPKVLAEELAFVSASVNAFRSEQNSRAQLVFECPSHSGGIGNFQIVLAAEQDGTVMMRLAQIRHCQLNSLRLPIQQLRTDLGMDVGYKRWPSRSFIERKLRKFIPVCVNLTMPWHVLSLKCREILGF